jgi:hypothetical protein
MKHLTSAFCVGRWHLLVIFETTAKVNYQKKYKRNSYFMTTIAVEIRNTQARSSCLNPSYSGNRNKKIMVQGQSQAKKVNKTPYQPMRWTWWDTSVTAAA